MATSGTYVAEVSLKGSAEKHYRRWRNENHLFPEAMKHHIQNVTVHHGHWDSHGAIKIWNYTCDGKQEMVKEKREIDDEQMTVKAIGLEGHVMEELKVNIFIFKFYPKPKEGCVCKITMIWEKKNDNVPEPTRYFKLAKQMVAELDDHVLKF